MENAAGATALVAERFIQHDLNYWQQALADEPGAWSALATQREVLKDPQVSSNAYVITNTDDQGCEYKIVAAPIQFDGAQPAPSRAPGHGQHTEEVLHELGLERNEIAMAEGQRRHPFADFDELRHGKWDLSNPQLPGVQAKPCRAAALREASNEDVFDALGLNLPSYTRPSACRRRHEKFTVMPQWPCPTTGYRLDGTPESDSRWQWR